ncbi:MAG: hypothetical protein JWQ81_7584 [Amycolatopsis sp.]|jgi:hypothetical protein|uniref:hypothetical protein n=1 Tax=Amycolatopsis sp. TaxID=37632 RepID=UPI0026256CAE|nr:hypothetical protein [Amycolatopsis sp.]MCU1686845.1 hypothetical protein [Amycolatopsis sp.]
MTVPVRTRPAQGAAGLEGIARWYRANMAWDTRVVGNDVRLRLGRGLVAFLTHGTLTSQVRQVLERAEVEAPLMLMGNPERGVFLADANDRFFSQHDMPAGVVFLSAPREIPLPPSSAVDRCVRWVAKPTPARRWLPAAETVFSAITTAALTLQMKI